MPPELSPKAIYDFAQTEKSFAISLFMPYDLEISIKPNITVNLGRFSLALLGRIQVIPAYDGKAQLTIGSFCEAARGATTRAAIATIAAAPVTLQLTRITNPSGRRVASCTMRAAMTDAASTMPSAPYTPSREASPNHAAVPE